MADQSNPPSSRKVDIELNDADFAEHSADHPSDQSVIGFRTGTLRELQHMSDELERLSGEVEQLNELLEAYRSPLYSLPNRDIVVIEVFLSLASIWAAFTLWHNPQLFESFPAAFRLIEMIQGNEKSWAVFALLAAALKVVGIATCVFGDTFWGRVVRYAGLAMSGLFWSMMGGGVMLGNPNTLFGFNSLLMGLFSWWSLLRLVK